MLKLKSFFGSPLWGKIFNRYNFTKAIIIFIVGFGIRVFITIVYDINVVWEVTNYISIGYYLFMAFFWRVVHESVIYFNFSILPKFIIDFFINIPKINFNCLKLSSIRNAIFYYLNRNKVNITKFDSPSNSIQDINSIKCIAEYSSIDSNNVTKNYDNVNSGNRNYSNGEGSSRINNQSNLITDNNNDNIDCSKDSLIEKVEKEIALWSNQGINRENSSINESGNIGLSNTSLELTPEKYNSKGDLLLSAERPPIFDANPKTPNPYEYLDTPSLDSNSIRFPSIPATPEINSGNVRFPFSNNGSITPPSQLNMSVDNSNKVSDLSLNSSYYTNDTNHGTLGTNDYSCIAPTPDQRNLEYRRQQIRNCFLESIPQDYITEELDIPKEGIKGKVKLGLKYFGSKVQSEISKLDSIYIKYNDIGKRHFYWTIWEKKRGTYSSYSEFKKDWDSNTSIWIEIKGKVGTNIKGKVERLVHEKDPFNRRLNNRNSVRILHESRYRKR